jgi:hypothetical protein
MSVSDWILWAPLVPLLALIFWVSNRHFHGFDTSIALSILHRARKGQLPGKDYPSTVPALYLAMLHALGPALRSWKAVVLSRLCFTILCYGLLVVVVPGLDRWFALIIILTGVIAIAGTTPVLWYSEFAHLHILLLALWAPRPPSDYLEAVVIGALGSLLVFQRPNVAWVFLAALMVALCVSWTPPYLFAALCGGVVAAITMHILFPHYAIPSLRRYFKLVGRASASFFFPPGLDIWMAVRWALVYFVLACSTLLLIIMAPAAAIGPDFIIAVGVIVSAFFGLKLSNEIKEPDMFMMVVGVFLAVRACPIPEASVAQAVLAGCFIAVAISLIISLLRAERPRSQSYVPLCKASSQSLSVLEKVWLRLGGASRNVGVISAGRDRYAARGESLRRVELGIMQGLCCARRLHETMDDFSRALNYVGRDKKYVFGNDIEWLGFAFDLLPTQGSPPAWHNQNMYLKEDVPGILKIFEENQDLVFVFTYKDHLRWMDYNFDAGVIEFFEKKLVIRFESRWLLFFVPRDGARG